MNFRFFLSLVTLAATLSAAGDGQALRLKVSARTDASGRITKRLNAGYSHLIVRFSSRPAEAELQALRDRGVRLLGPVPDNGYLALAPRGMDLAVEGIERVRPLEPEEKMSPLLTDRDSRTLLIEFHPDVEPWEARAIALREGLRIREHPDLRDDHLLVEGTSAAIEGLAEWDEVAYLFPASPEMDAGEEVIPYASAIGTDGPVAQFIAAVGPGWDGYGQGSAELSYSFEQLSAKLSDEVVREQILLAMAEWSRYVQVDFSPGGVPSAKRNVNYLFGTGDYGSLYPFDGPGKVLAQTFYPSPPNPEPIAGDVHFDDDENWNVGVRIDLFSVALHELGHALGLAHSDDPGDVMYPYYRQVSELSTGDILAIQQLYAAAEEVEPIEPLELDIQSPDPLTTTEDPSTTVSGVASGGVAPLEVAWLTNRGASGQATGAEEWVTPVIPLSYGINTITIAVTDARGARRSKYVRVDRVESTPDPDPGPEPDPEPEPEPEPEDPPVQSSDTTPPTLKILSPSTTVVTTSADIIEIRGTAQDNVDVSVVTWNTNAGADGVATGTSFWRAGGIPLLRGTNIVIIHAYDAAENHSWRSVMVNRR